MRIKKIFLLISLSIIGLSIIFSVLSSIQAVEIGNARIDYFEEENIYFERFSVQLEDGISIKGFLYVDTNNAQITDHSIPTILMLHGINQRKEEGFSKIYQFVKRDYAVFSVEERGHGESGGICGFLGKEPYDMIQVIDFIEHNYEFTDYSRMGIYGFSFGGGVGTILQAIDERIYVSVLYHPLSSIESFTKEVPFQHLLGMTPSISNFDDIKDGFDVCTPENTKNMLLIHGDQDTVINTQDSRGLYHLVDGDNRDDISLEIRLGLDHVPNEGDEISLKHSLVWFEHFYHDETIDIINRGEEIKSIELYEVDYPGYTSSPEDMIWYAAILMFTGLFILVLPFYVWPTSKKESILNLYKGSSNRIESQYRRMVFHRIIAYLLVSVGGSIIFAIFNRSYVYGYFIGIPIATVIVMLFIPKSEFPNWQSEWQHWQQNSLKISLVSSSIIVLPILFFVLIFNANAKIMISRPIPFFTTTSMTYLGLALGLIYADYFLLRGWKFKHTLLLFGLRPLTILIFFLLMPLPPFPYLVGLEVGIYVLIGALIGVLFWFALAILYLFGHVLKNKITLVLIVFLPLIIFLIYRFFRII